MLRWMCPSTSKAGGLNRVLVRTLKNTVYNGNGNLLLLLLQINWPMWYAG